MSEKKRLEKAQKTTKLIIPRNEFIELLQKRIQEGNSILNKPINNESTLKETREEYYIWNDFNSELLKSKFNNEENEYKESYDNVNSIGVFFSGEENGLYEEIESFKSNVKNKINNLQSLLKRVELLKSEIGKESIKGEKMNEYNYNDSDIFIVHGHNNEIKESVARLLENQNLNPIILHEKPNQGRTIIEKFEHNTQNTGFAVILLTDDDKGKAKSDLKLKMRPRQNVVLELGYFIGKLGRSRICPLYTKGVELPNDFSGVVYNEIDSNDAWKLKLIKELKAAGYDVDANKL